MCTLINATIWFQVRIWTFLIIEKINRKIVYLMGGLPSSSKSYTAVKLVYKTEILHA